MPHIIINVVEISPTASTLLDRYVARGGNPVHVPQSRLLEGSEFPFPAQAGVIQRRAGRDVEVYQPTGSAGRRIVEPAPNTERRMLSYGPSDSDDSHPQQRFLQPVTEGAWESHRSSGAGDDPPAQMPPHPALGADHQNYRPREVDESPSPLTLSQPVRELPQTYLPTGAPAAPPPPIPTRPVAGVDPQGCQPRGDRDPPPPIPPRNLARGNLVRGCHYVYWPPGPSGLQTQYGSAQRSSSMVSQVDRESASIMPQPEARPVQPGAGTSPEVSRPTPSDALQPPPEQAQWLRRGGHLSHPTPSNSVRSRTLSEASQPQARVTHVLVPLTDGHTLALPDSSRHQGNDGEKNDNTMDHALYALSTGCVVPNVDTTKFDFNMGPTSNSSGDSGAMQSLIYSGDGEGLPDSPLQSRSAPLEEFYGFQRARQSSGPPMENNSSIIHAGSSGLESCRQSPGSLLFLDPQGGIQTSMQAATPCSRMPEIGPREPSQWLSSYTATGNPSSAPNSQEHVLTSMQIASPLSWMPAIGPTEVVTRPASGEPVEEPGREVIDAAGLPRSLRRVARLHDLKKE